MKKLYLFLLFLSSFSFSQILTDDFNYSDNSLLTANGWTTISGSGTQPIDVGASNGLEYPGYSGATGFTGVDKGNAARLDNNGEDVNRTFAAVTNGSIYYSFLLNVTTAADGNFTGLSSSSTTFFARLFLKSLSANTYSLGISNTTTASLPTAGTGVLNTGKTYLVVVKYNVSTLGETSLWVFESGVPATEASAGTPYLTTSGSGSATVSSFYLRQYNASQNLTMDGLRLYSTWFNTSPCPLILGAESVSCDAITFNTDTYTATIPFTGGNSGSYTLSTNVGTIAGDNPSVTQNGNILITGIPEGTNVTLTVSGACAFTKSILAPTCKPVNTLPVNESFNYTAGEALTTQQTWSTMFTGDDILVTNGSLSYPGITSSYNSVTFSGAGAEARLPFTTTSAGVVNASMLLNVADFASVTNDLSAAYFAVFGDDNLATNYMARLFVRKNGTKYQFGLDTANTTTNWSAITYDLNTVQYLTMSYDFVNNKLYLFENEQATTPTVTVVPTTAIPSIGSFVLRQDNAGVTPTILLDELKINTDTSTLGTSDVAKSKINLVKSTVVKDVLTFGAKANVKVVNFNGQVLKSVSVENGTTLDVSSLPKGIYVVTGEVNGQSVSQKIVKE